MEVGIYGQYGHDKIEVFVWREDAPPAEPNTLPRRRLKFCTVHIVPLVHSVHLLCYSSSIVGFLEGGRYDSAVVY